MTNKTYAVTGATGHVGKVVAEKLEGQCTRASKVISGSVGIPSHL